MEGAFYFKPYLQWLFRTLPGMPDDVNSALVFKNKITILTKLGIYKSFNAVMLDLMLTNEDTRTLNFLNIKTLKKDLNTILFCNRNFDNKLVERNAVSNFGYQSYTTIKFNKDTSSKIDYNKFVFDFLNLFDFERIDKQVSEQAFCEN